ncbi:MAG: quaternary ammonium compound-resistance protein SugE [Candidatus Brocadia sp. AMX2]|uniref:Guanidinium exporter n=1 Tax=Candidatus Brocadia sinica JPN1 TaxID=1197129 RepID=A0ABQ0JUE0_9BACT|nr:MULTISPECIES: quaternary ammonium compound efflux SMR transporter SugE [Brocadia]KXK28635.1 MAG: small multidrug resistance protein [Candidatus Brocadia sinica]MBC6931988.1 quaternary ammonium compound-resistance protein SugE [Candidatus Brocadia sp.]MBL1168249.1 quaternary ammonium compound-resistance protein SugE [Candidatus Brocadia sp. AMX1]NOG39979.1 quaternary ammonium compound efflux SMR transporter SugE [Planctomycetota bacterium]KAA0243493.1 MAG: quaternary ammonium compound efflux
MSWILLFVAGIFEVVWAVGLKYTHGFTRLLPSMVTAFAMIMSFVLLGIAARGLPIGTSYAVWTGIGTVGTVIAGIFLFHEPRDWGRICCILLILLGVAGLKILGR